MRGPVIGILCALTMVIPSGCGGGGEGVTVSGTVTYDGKPVPSGHVTLAPADGKGPSFGGDIHDGRFTIRGVLPGEKIVSVTGGETIEFPKTSEEMEKLAAERKTPGTGWQIPPNAKGNNQRITISKSNQELKLELSPP